MKLKIQASKITQRYKKTANWRGFWIKDNNDVAWTTTSHQDALNKNLGPSATYDEAFDEGWIRGYIQSGEVGIEARSLVDKFKFVQKLILELADKFKVSNILIDLNNRAYSIPFEDFSNMNKSNEIRNYQVA